MSSTCKKSMRHLSLLVLCALILPMFNCFAFLMPVAAEEEKSFTNLYEVEGSGIPNTTLNGTFIAAGNYRGSKAIAVTEGDVIYWGPARIDQNWHIRTYKADGTTATANDGCVGYGAVSAESKATLYETIADNIGILKYVIPAGVTHIRITTDQLKYNIYATKNTPLTGEMCFEDLYEYGDSGIPTSPQGTFTSAGGAWYASKTIPVAEGDVIYFGGADLTQSWHIAGYAADGTRPIANKGTTHATFASNTNIGVVKYTIPANVVSVRITTRITAPIAITKNQPFDEAIYNSLFLPKAQGNLYEVDRHGLPGATVDAFLSGWTDWVTSKPINVASGDAIYAGWINMSQGWYLACYNVSGSQASTLSPKAATLIASTTVDGVDYGILKYNVPAGTEYVRIVSNKLDVPVAITRNCELNQSNHEALVDRTVGEFENLFKIEAKAIPGTSTVDAYSNNNDYFLSKPINVTAGDVLYFGPIDDKTTSTQSWYAAAYDASGKYLGKMALNTTHGIYVAETFTYGSTPILKWTITEGIAQVRFTTKNQQTSTIITKNQPIDMAYYNRFAASIENLYVPHAYGIANTTVATIASNYSYATSEIISVKEGDKVYLGPYSSQDFGLIAYNASGSMVDQKATLSTAEIYDTLDDGSKIICWTVPAGATQMRATVTSAYAKTAVLTINRPFDRVLYGQYKTAHVASNYGHGAEPKESVLSGMDALFVGDSITYGSYDVMAPSQATSWAGRLAANTGLNVVNAGVGGATLAQVSGKGWIYDQLNSNKEKDFDLIVMHGGINDSRNSVEIGTPTYSNDPTVLGANLSTYAGGLEWLFYNATQNWPDAERFYIANFRVGDTAGRVQEIGEYFEVAKEICEAYGVTYIDLYDNEELTAKLQPTTRTYMADLLHPSSKGYDIIFPYVLAPIEERVAQDNYMDSILTAQVNINAEKTLRFLTTVDHLDYTEVGFRITRSSDGLTARVSTTTVYGSVLVDSNTVVASDISGIADSKYIALYHVAGIHSETEIKVRAFVVTQDGKTVYGDTLTVTIP